MMARGGRRRGLAALDGRRGRGALRGVGLVGRWSGSSPGWPPRRPVRPAWWGRPACPRRRLRAAGLDGSRGALAAGIWIISQFLLCKAAGRWGCIFWGARGLRFLPDFACPWRHTVRLGEVGCLPADILFAPAPMAGGGGETSPRGETCPRRCLPETCNLDSVRFIWVYGQIAGKGQRNCEIIPDSRWSCASWPPILMV